MASMAKEISKTAAAGEKREESQQRNRCGESWLNETAWRWKYQTGNEMAMSAINGRNGVMSENG